MKTRQSQATKAFIKDWQEMSKLYNATAHRADVFFENVLKKLNRQYGMIQLSGGSSFYYQDRFGDKVILNREFTYSQGGSYFWYVTLSYYSH